MINEGEGGEDEILEMEGGEDEMIDEGSSDQHDEEWGSLKFSSLRYFKWLFVFHLI